MKLAEAVTRLYLHDSVVQDVTYIPHEKRLILAVELCNWAQPGYVDGEPELVTTSLAFDGVTSYQVRPERGAVRGGQILTARVSAAEGEDSGEVLRLVLAGCPQEDVTMMTIAAESVVLERGQK